MIQRVLIITLGYLMITLFVFWSPGRSISQGFEVNEKVIQGATIWRRENCSACHSIYGLGGHMGPDLTNTIKNRGIAYTRVVIENGIPGMPAFSLPEEDMLALLEYLNLLNASGTYPLRNNFSVFGEFP